MSIVRVGMAEDGKFGDGYEAIFGKKTSSSAKATRKVATKKPAMKKKPAVKKKK